MSRTRCPSTSGHSRKVPAVSYDMLLMSKTPEHSCRSMAPAAVYLPKNWRIDPTPPIVLHPAPYIRLSDGGYTYTIDKPADSPLRMMKLSARALRMSAAFPSRVHSHSLLTHTVTSFPLVTWDPPTQSDIPAFCSPLLGDDYVSVHAQQIGFCDKHEHPRGALRVQRNTQGQSEWEAEITNVLLDLVTRTYGHAPHLPLIQEAVGRIAKILAETEGRASGSYWKFAAIVQDILQMASQTSQTLSVALVLSGIYTRILIGQSNGMKRANAFQSCLQRDILENVNLALHNSTPPTVFLARISNLAWLFVIGFIGWQPILSIVIGLSDNIDRGCSAKAILVILEHVLAGRMTGQNVANQDLWQVRDLIMSRTEGRTWQDPEKRNVVEDIKVLLDLEFGFGNPYPYDYYSSATMGSPLAMPCDHRAVPEREGTWRSRNSAEWLKRIADEESSKRRVEALLQASVKCDESLEKVAATHYRTPS
ncbi:hypothetical protein SISSUDRAFT_1128028 [Sistotremastrum suecicum HHB10207 ss-3]|nr:hypothetical protein SISSUDRAFT_1128028 [Sistotremastrum suecicum HHB10207 ss-3]